MTKTKIFAPAMLLGSLISASALAADNPMNRIGLEQNTYVGCLMAKGPTSSITSLERVATECGYDHGVTTEEFVKIYSPLVGTDPLLPSAKRMASHAAVFTAYEFSYFERTDSALALATSYASADASIAKLEEEAIAKLDPKSESGKALLSGLSATRASLKYWAGRSVPYRQGQVMAGSAMMGGVIGDGGAGAAAAASVGAYYVARTR
ncbi:MAG: hypothetical protein ACOY82_12245 [Pseudomonadota bacterium]